MLYISFDTCKKEYKDQHSTATRLLQKMLESLGYTDFSVEKSENGRPFCINGADDISISHSANLAAVAVVSPVDTDIDCSIALPVNKSRVGIDIEKLDESADISKLQRLADRFLDTKITSREQFFRIWTKNEARGKITGEGVINSGDICCESFEFVIETYGDKYILSVAVC